MIKNLKKSISIFLSILCIFILVGCNNISINSNDSNESNVSTITSVEELKNIENFRDGALEHIFEGEVNSRGKAVGYHYEGIPDTKGEVIEGTRSTPNEEGVYTAKVRVDGVNKVSNGGKSSFFPEEWTAQEVVDNINEAYEDRIFVNGTDNTYRGETSDGVIIEMYIDSSNYKIISAFPVY